MSPLYAGDGIDIDPSDPQYERQLADWISGTYSSGWSSLKMAYAGSAIAAVQATATTMNVVQRALDSQKDHSEISVLADFNYRVFALGPCLSAVLLASFALESYLRLGFQVALELRRGDHERRRGFAKSINAATKTFDGLAASKRLDELATHLGIGVVSKSVATDADNLIRFRNDCVHDSPVLTLAPGSHRKPSSKKRDEQTVGPGIGPYNRLSLSRQPARLSHVVVAAEAHDSTVRHFQREMMGSAWLEAVAQLDGSSLGDGTLTGALPSSLSWRTVCHVADEWERLQDQFPPGAMRDAALTIRRRKRIKLADPLADRPGASDDREQ